MFTWKQYCESKKSGLDLDKDQEKGEPKEHIEKIKKTKEEMLEFFHKRKEGAAKIASAAKEKGGPSILTFWHFAIKNKPYEEVIKAIEDDKPKSFFMSKCKNLLSKIHCDKMSQKDFQELMGELEVAGEAMAQLFQHK